MKFNLTHGAIFLALIFAAVGCSAPAAPAPAPTNTAAPVPVQPTRASAPTSAPTATAGASSIPASGDVVRLTIVPEKSQAQYRVREQLARVNFPSDAVGVTKAITGTIVGKIDGMINSADSKFVVDLRTLTSDSPQRDGFLRDSTLQTRQFPNATFVPKSATGLPTNLASAKQADFKLTGDLTIRNTTKSVTWDVSCQTQSETQGTCKATTSFKFGDVGLTIPQVFTVLSIDDKITLEIDFTFQRS